MSVRVRAISLLIQASVLSRNQLRTASPVGPALINASRIVLST
jgi:hypothetical protein